MCLKSGTALPCSGSIVQGSAQWGLTDGVCQAHWDWAQDFSQSGGTKGLVPQGLLDDYTRIFLLLERDKKTVERCLASLGSEIGNLEGRTGYIPNRKSSDQVKLSAALERYETYCWFPPCGDTFVGQLASDRFLNYLKQGLMAKDPGAGPKHGDFTHRIHWHVVSRVITNDFTTQKREGWGNTPLKLFTFLGEPEAINAKLWFNLFESGGSSSYRFPDTLNKHVCEENRYGMLSKSAGKRFEKRMRELDAVTNKEQLNNFSEDLVSKNTFSNLEKLASLGRANQAYQERVRLRYGQTESTDAVLNRRNIQNPEPNISSRITQSYTGFNNNLADGSESLSYSKAIGMVRFKRLFRRR